MPTFGSLFTGIGGLDLGLEWAGWDCRWQAEFDPLDKRPAAEQFNQRVLARHWPDVTRYGDVRSIDYRHVEPVDLIVGGFPCQPVSVAGKRLAQDDPRWLWPELARAIRELRPRLVLVENVPGLLARGMGDVLGDLADLGFDAEWSILSAADVGAPHLRKRVWIVAVAHPDGEQHGRLDAGREDGQATPVAAGSGLGPPADPDRGRRDARVDDPGRHAGSSERAPGSGDTLADAEGFTLWPGLRSSSSRRLGGRRSGDGGGAGAPDARPDADGFDVEPRGSRAGARPSPGRRLPADPDAVGERLEGLEQTGPAPRPAHGSRDGRDPGWWTVEPDVGRVAHGVPARVDRLRALGNAVVPHVAFEKGLELMDIYHATERGRP